MIYKLRTILCISWIIGIISIILWGLIYAFIYNCIMGLLLSLIIFTAVLLFFLVCRLIFKYDSDTGEISLFFEALFVKFRIYPKDPVKARKKKIKAELKKYKEQEEGLSTNSDGEFEETSSNDGLPTEEASDNPTEETSDLPETITEPNKENTSRGFRKIQTIDKNEVFDRRSELNSKKEIFTASYSRTETLKFAKEETTDETTPLTDAPTGKNAATDEYIISDELAQYCNLNINKASESEIRDCLEKLIAYQSETNMTTAEKGKNFVYSVLYDAAIALTAEAAYYKNVASNYKTDVLGPKKTDENKSQTDTRDDIKVLSSNVKLLQALMANVNKIYASRLLYEGLNEATQYQLKDVNSSTADTSSGTDEKTTEKGA